MPNTNAHQQPPANTAGGFAYSPSKRVDPLPRQLHRTLQQHSLTMSPNCVRQQMYPIGTSTAIRQRAPVRPAERVALLGLWALVILATVAVALRFIDLPAVDRNLAMAARDATTPAAGVPTGLAMMAADNADPFDDPLPAHSAVSAEGETISARPAKADLPLAYAPNSRLAAKHGSVVQPAGHVAQAVVPVPLKAGRQAEEATGPAPSASCSEALRAMQLCTEQK